MDKIRPAKQVQSKFSSFFSRIMLDRSIAVGLHYLLSRSSAGCPSSAANARPSISINLVFESSIRSPWGDFSDLGPRRHPLCPHSACEPHAEERALQQGNSLE